MSSVLNLVRGNILTTNKSSFHGWIVGHMHSGLGHTTDVEVKLWLYPAQPEYPKKIFGGTEVIVIFGGIIVLHLEKSGLCETVELKGASGDYIILGPNIVKYVEVKEAPAHGVCIRWPSTPFTSQIASL